MIGLHLFLSWRQPYKKNASVLKVSEVDTDLERRFLSFKVTTSNESSLFVAFQGIAPENSWLSGAFLKDYKIIRKIKMREMKTK